MANYYDHPEYKALYQALIDHPDDRTAAGVLADWLDEHDQPEQARAARAGAMNDRLQLAAAAKGVAAAMAPMIASLGDAARHLGDVILPIARQLGEAGAAAQQSPPDAPPS